MADVYGWGGTFDADLLLRNLAALFYGCGLAPALFGPPRSLVDLYYSATNPGRASLEELSVPIFWEPDPLDPSSNVLSLDLQLGLLPIPPASDNNAAPSGLVLFPRLSGGTSVSFDITESVRLTIEGGFQAALVRLTSTRARRNSACCRPPRSSRARRRDRRPPQTPWILLGAAEATRLELDGAHFKLGAKGTPRTSSSRSRVGSTARVSSCRWTSPTAFSTKILGTEPIEVPFSVAASWSSKTGFRFEGEVGINLTLPLHLSIAGVFTIDALYIALSAGVGNNRPRRARYSPSRPGSSWAPRVRRSHRDGAGPGAAAGGPAPATSGRSTSSRVQAADGAGLSVSAGPVTGGGYIFFDPENEQYAGILQLSFKTIGLTVIGLLTTPAPRSGGRARRLQEGVLAACSSSRSSCRRSSSATASRSTAWAACSASTARWWSTSCATASATARSTRSCSRRTPSRGRPRSSAVARHVPARRGAVRVRSDGQVGWGPNAIIEVSAALVLELAAPIRLVVLGRIQLALPDKKITVLKLRLDVVGVIDFDRGEVSVDASLVDSRRRCSRSPATWRCASGWGATKIFALAAGGFHPRFLPPPGFPSLRRLAIALADSDNPRAAAGDVPGAHVQHDPVRRGLRRVR